MVFVSGMRSWSGLAPSAVVRCNLQEIPAKLRYSGIILLQCKYATVGRVAMRAWGALCGRFREIIACHGIYYTLEYVCCTHNHIGVCISKIIYYSLTTENMRNIHF